ncbi:MAG: ferrous iron transport protein A [Candidatus Methanomethylophilaceae archaeon]|nr:ferrous iron transport protein A [Candidatus Methanomethylophilaceae archaeon]
MSTSVFCTGGSDGKGACDLCHGGCGETDAPLVSLKDMDVGDKGTIVRLTSDNDSLLRRLISMGFVPSRPLQLAATVSDKGARVVRIGYATIALDADAASAIFVRRG